MAKFWKGLFILFVQFSTGVQGSVELFALGFSNGYVQNEQLSASSVYGENRKEFGAEQARLNIYSGWCGNKVGPVDWYTEWLQVDFREPVAVLGIGLQGSRRKEDADYYATSFYLQVTNSSVFQNITNRSGQTKIFEGINDTRKTSYQWFDRPVSGRIFRFRPHMINNPDSSSTRVCARLEYYGYGLSTGKAGCQDLYPLGMINGGIANEQLSASSSNSLNEDQTKARLNRDGKLGWCSAGKQYPNEWLQIDLKQQTVVTAIATQGDGYGDIVTHFFVAFGNTTSSLHRIQDPSGGDHVFTSNTNLTYAIPLLNFFPTPITTRYVRIIPRSTTSKTFCLRLELFGYGSGPTKPLLPFAHPVIHEKIGTVVYKNLSTIPILRTMDAHCLGSSSAEPHYLTLQLPAQNAMTGIGVQGYPKADSWVKTFNFSFWDSNTLTWIHHKTLPGGQSSMDTAYHWWSESLRASAVKVQPLTWESQPCLSLQLYGSLADQNVTVLESSTQHYTCPLSHCPSSKVEWFKNGATLNYTHRTLILDNIRRTDSGDYHCTEHNITTGLKSPIYSIKVLYLEKPKLNISRSVHINEGTSLTVQCYIDAYPSVNQTWQKGMNNETVSNTPWLTLTNVTRNGSDAYFCKGGSSELGTVSEFFSLTVRYMDIPTLNVTAQVTKREGTSLSVSCTVSSFPKATIRWVESNGRNISGGAILVLRNISRSDAKNYSCIASHPTIQATRQSFALTVHYLQEPTVNSTAELVIQEGRHVYVTCYVVGHPKAYVYWIYEDNTVVSNNSNLVLPLVLRSMKGRYTCRARNAFGERSKEVQIRVLYFDCPNTPCQNGGQCKTKITNECECKKSFYGRYCQTDQNILETRLIIKLIGIGTGKSLNKSETEMVVGANDTKSYQSITGEIQRQVEIGIKRVGELNEFFLSTEITAVRFSSIDMSLNIYLRTGLNKSISEFQHLLNNSLSTVNVTLKLSQSLPVGFVMVLNKLHVQDHDECAAGSNHCPEGTTCQNAPYSYTCACMDGYSQRNGTCEAEIAKEDSRGVAAWIIVTAVIVPFLLLLLLLALIHHLKSRQKVHRSEGEFHKD